MNNLNRIQLGGLRALEATGRLGGLRPAAEELGVTVGAVSQQIQKVEKQIGRRMFERLPKGLKLTPLGEEVIGHLTAGMSELSAAIAIAENRAEDTLTVSVAPVLAAKWLVWRLPRFNEQIPDIHIRIDAGKTSLVDPNLSGVDATIRVGRGDWPGVKAERLIDQYVFPVCSPALAKTLTAPTDLSQVPIIRDSGTMFDWNVWLAPHGLDEALLGGGPTYSDGSLCLDAAVAGQGVFLAWETLACDALDAGRLAAPFPERRPTGISYWFVTAQNATRTPSIAALHKWLKEELDASLAF